MKYICKNCNNEFISSVCERKFCSRSCSAIFNNKNRKCTQETRKKISIKNSKEKQIIPYEEFIKLYNRFKSIRGISIHLGVSRHIIREHFIIYNINIKTVNKKTEKYCKKHDIFYTTKKCKKCASLAVIKFRRRLKKKCLDYKGGKCERCGYYKCNDALEFHHLDENEKDFGISANGIARNWNLIKNELDKCILLCSNCHREVHYEQRQHN